MNKIHNKNARFGQLAAGLNRCRRATGEPGPAEPPAGRVAPGRQSGFVITVEFILFTTILVIGLFLGFAAIRDALFKHYVKKQSEAVYVYDTNGVVLGKAVDFDEHEAPRIPYIDRSVPPASPDPDHRNYRALVGVRDDRFTSRQRIFYLGPQCTGTACIASPSSESTDSTGIDGQEDTGGVGYLYGLQGAPTYAIGAGLPPDARLPGWLFRQSELNCDATQVQSAWTSQLVVAGEPCELWDAFEPIEARTCQGDYGTSNNCQADAEPPCTAIPNNNNVLCGCPVGWVRTGGPQSACCPPDSDLVAGQCARNLTDFFQAESVPHPDDAANNALQGLGPNFFVNYPIDPDSWIYVAPDGVEGDPAAPQADIMFVAPDGEGPP